MKRRQTSRRVSRRVKRSRREKRSRRVSRRVKSARRVSRRVKSARRVSRRVKSARRVSRRVKRSRRVSRRVKSARRVSRRVKSARRVSRRVKSSRRVSRRVKKNPKIKRKGSYPAIFVINLRRDPDKWSKYKDDSRFIRYSACNGIEMSQENPYYDKLQIMWNVGDRKRKCTAGILNSHMSIIKKIVKQKINQALILEDDAIVDFKILNKLDLNKLPQDSITYFGGTLHPPDTFKNKSWKHSTSIKQFKKGINRIDPTKYRILGGHGYYFPTWEIAKELLDIVDKKKKMRALDTEMVFLQRKGIIKYFYYPAISYLYMEDAKKGVHATHMSRDMKHYG